jgi:hypothetical protein
MKEMYTVGNVPPAGGRYFSWYSDYGHLETIQGKLLADLHNWRSTYGKSYHLMFLKYY